MTNLKAKLNLYFAGRECTSWMHEEYSTEGTWQTPCDDFETDELKNVKYKCVDNYGGEDQGSDYYAVYEFTEGTEKEYIKFQGWYASHYGSEFRELTFVTPKSKQVTVYE